MPGCCLLRRVLDFHFSACDDGTIRLWIIPEDGLPEPTNTPDQILARHSEKIYFIKFHPLAKDVLASGSYDMTIRIWDLLSQTEKIVLEGHTDQVWLLSFYLLNYL